MMNARMIHADPEAMSLHAETCSAVAFLLLETSSKYFDLQFGALRSALESFRSHYELLAAPADQQDVLATCGTMLNQSLDAGGRLLCEGFALSSGSQRELRSLLDQGWGQMREIANNAVGGQIALMHQIGQSLTAKA